jgi:hypothetical protein
MDDTEQAKTDQDPTSPKETRTATRTFADGSKITIVAEGGQAYEVFRRASLILEGNGLTDDELTLLASLLIEYQVVQHPEDSTRAEAILNKLQKLGQVAIDEAFTKAPTYQKLMDLGRLVDTIVAIMPPAAREAALSSMEVNLTEEEYNALRTRLRGVAK